MTTQYEQALTAMERLLCAVNEKHWGDWVREDLNRWRASSDTSHHLSAYGAMGSFNDVAICHGYHKVNTAQEPWAIVLFEWLRAVCYYLAHHPHEQFAAPALARLIGRHESSLAAFVGGDKAPASMRGYVGSDHSLGGWRCGACGHAEVSIRHIDYYIAEDVIPRMVFDACEKGTLNEVVDTALSLDIQGLEESRRELVLAAEASGIVVRDKEGWMWECPKCGQQHSCVPRWKYLQMEGRFELSEDCLPQHGARWWQRLLHVVLRMLTW